MNSRSISRRFRVISALMLAVACAAFGTQTERAEIAQAAPPADPSQNIQMGQAGLPEALHLLVRRSLVITSPVRIRRVSIADPSVIDAVVVEPTQIVVNGKTPGASSLVVWDENGQSQAFEVVVDIDAVALREKVREVLPQEPIEVQGTREIVTLSGRVSSQAVAERVIAIAQAMVKKEAVVSLLQLPPVPAAPTTGEVLLQVKFADVDRATLSQLGANFLYLPPAKLPFSTSTQQFGPPSLQSGAVGASGIGGGFNVSDLLNVFLFRPDLDVAATIRALAVRNLLEVLAEPNVLAETGKEASFLAGGEFPFPVIQNAAGGLPVVTIQFREFGVKLLFTPNITPEGLIHLKVAPEVSSLDFTNALVLSGFTIPSIAKRRVESEMILKDGQSFVIAGLVNNQVISQFSKIPGIGDIPILGKLFQSRSLNKSRGELLVTVTPRIVHPETAPLQPEPPAELQYPTPFLSPLPPPEPSGAKK